MFSKRPPENKPTTYMYRKKNGDIECPEYGLSFSGDNNKTAEEKAIEWFCKYRGEMISLLIRDEE